MLLEVPQHQYPRVFPVAGGGGRLRVLAALVTRVSAPGEELGQWLRLWQHEAPDHLHPQHWGHGGLRVPAQLAHRDHLCAQLVPHLPQPSDVQSLLALQAGHPAHAHHRPGGAGGDQA